jgi:hypothetical protein
MNNIYSKHTLFIRNILIYRPPDTRQELIFGLCTEK